MKRIIFVIVFLSLAFAAQAQRWTIWYGVNLSNEMKNGPLKAWHFANGGVDYTIPVSQWDFTVGAGLNTTGGRRRINYAQLESNAGYRFLDTDSGFKLSALAGPFVGIRVADDRNLWAPQPPEVKPAAWGVAGRRPAALPLGCPESRLPAGAEWLLRFRCFVPVLYSRRPAVLPDLAMPLPFHPSRLHVLAHLSGRIT